MNRIGVALLFYLVVLAGAFTIVSGDASVVYTGDATTYNPFLKGGYKTGGGQTATGPRYNPDGWEAALQLDLAKKHGCGYGRNKTCYAAVQAPNGRSMIVLINDNGPMCADSGVRCGGNRFQRIIDLNEKSMRYLGNDPAGLMYGNNRGLIKNVKVALLSGNQYKLGPIDEKDRDAWAKKIMNGPTGDLNPSGYPPPQPYYHNPNGTWTTTPLSSLYNQQPPPMNLPPPQLGNTQLGQYFENPPLYSTPPTTSTSTATSSSSKGGSGSSIADELLDLIKSPDEKSKEKAKPIVVNSSLKETESLEAPGTTKVELVPLNREGIYPVAPQTFAQPVGSPIYSGGTIQSPDTFVAMLESLRSALQSILNLLNGL